jgi:hypothetical protein
LDTSGMCDAVAVREWGERQNYGLWLQQFVLLVRKESCKFHVSSLFPLQSSGKKCLLWNWKKKMAGVTPVQEMCCNVTFVHQKAGTVGRTEGKGEQGNFWKELFADTNWIRFIFLAVFVAYSSKLCFSVTRIPAGDEIRLDQWPMDFNFKARWSNQNSATKQRRPLSYCSCPQQVQPLLK